MPSIWLRRSIAAALALFFIVAAAVLLWSDHVGSVLDAVHDVVIDTGRRVEQRYEVDVVDRDDIPGTTDQIGHASLWGSGMLIAGWALRRRVPIALTAIFVTGISMVFEFAQPVLSSTRVVEPTDIVGNVAGIVAAAALLLVAHAAFRVVAGDDREYFDERVYS